MANKGYQSYRGRRGGRGRLLVCLLVLILLAACAFIFLQRYVTYSDDGSFYWDLPFFQKEEPTPAPDTDGGGAGQDVNLIIDEPEDPEPEPPAASPYGARRLVELAALPADGAALSGLLGETGANGFACTLRDNTGCVYFDSAAAIPTAVKDTAMKGADLSALCAVEDVVSVARLNCFHDSYYAWGNMESAGICQSTGYIWYDNLSYHWLDPAKEQARRYVISLALECAQLGFDELLLEEVCYPASGNLNKIDYSGNELGKTEALVRFLTELREALSSYDVKLSLLLSERLFTAEGGEYAAESGQDLTQLLPLVDAVYVPAADMAAAQDALAAASGENEPPVLIPITETAGNGENWYFAP